VPSLKIVVFEVADTSVTQKCIIRS